VQALQREKEKALFELARISGKRIALGIGDGMAD
jgi:hypothetical protein